MIADLKPYADYKDSGQTWLGKVPEHWAVRRMKYVVHEVDSQSTSGKEQLLRVSQYTGVTQRSRADGTDEPDTRADSLVGYKSVRVNDLVVNIMLAWNGSMGVSRYEGIASPAYCVYSFASEQHPWYFHNLLRSPAYKAQIKASSTGVVESRLRLYSDDLGRIVATIPSPNEQAAIVKYLDGVTAQLDAATRAKRKVIALLNEQKQAIIHRAVTRGLNHQIKLKTSDVDWAGEIPQEWSEYPLRRLATCDNSGSYGRDPSPTLQELPVATTAQIDRNGHFNVGKMPRRGFTSAEINRFCCKPGDILVVKSSGSAANVISGKCGIVERDTPAFVYSNFLARFIANEALIKPHYLYLLLTSYITRERVKRMVSTTTYPNLRMGEYRGALLPVPPLEVQQQILEAVRIEVSSVEQAALRLEREIELLREYRTRLVADVVTGKLDVREAAAGLPDEVPLETVKHADVVGEDLDNADEEATT